jgi:hypothetical protein
MTQNKDWRIPSMKIYAALLILVFAKAGGSGAQTVVAENSRREQRQFGLEEPIKQPISIPDDVLGVVREGSEFLSPQCEEEAGSHDRIPAAWYEATRISLGTRNKVGLIVKAKTACLWGANTGPFWIFLEEGEHHSLIFYKVVGGLQVLRSKTHGVYDVRTGLTMKLRPSFVIYRYDGHEYQPN